MAYILPIAFLHIDRTFNPDVVRRFTVIMMQGTPLLYVGALFGMMLWSPSITHSSSRFVHRVYDADFERPISRARTLLIIALLLFTVSLIYTKNIPLLASDQLSAKFFKGEYYAAYQRISVLYRFAWIIIPALLSVAIVQSFRGTIRRGTWRFLLLCSVIAALVTLQRSSLGNGILMLLLFWLLRRNYRSLVIVVSIGSYMAGALIYQFFAFLGLMPTIEGASAAPGSGFIASISATTPDVSDALGFLSRWTAAGSPLTHGRTLYGGLIPGNYPWNASIWSLTLGDPSVDVSSVASGGLRLPVQIWGLVNFGPAGVFILSFFGGLTLAFTTLVAKGLLESSSHDMVQLSFYGPIGLLFVGELGSSFFKISYLWVVELFLWYWLLRPRRLSTLNVRAPNGTFLWSSQSSPDVSRFGSGSAVCPHQHDAKD